MELDQSKPNQVKQKIALTSTIALLSASVGVSHHVKADDLKSSDETKASNTNEDGLVRPKTFEEAMATVKTVEASLNQQRQALSETEASLSETEAEVTQLEATKTDQEAELVSAKTVYEEATTISKEALAAQVKEHQAQLLTTEKDLVEAETDSQTKSAELAKQEQVITTESDQAKTLAQQVAAAEQNVSQLNDMITKPKAISEEAQAAKDSTKLVADQLQQAKADLESQKETVKAQLTQDLAANKAALADKEAELKRLEMATPTGQSSIVGNNTMRLPDQYPFEEIKKLAASGYIGTASYNKYYSEHAQEIISKATPGDQLNQYIDIPSDLTRVVDPDNLTPEVQNELAQFAAQMLNAVRQQLGLPPVVVTAGSQEFARLLSKSYKQTHGNVRPSFVYGQPGVSGHYGVGPHDKTIIEASAESVGLRKNDDNMYENLGAFNDVRTVNGIKRGIYDCIKYMLFNDHLHGNTYGHAVNFLRVDKNNPSAPVYLGFSTSGVQSLTEHFVIFPESNIVNHSRFDKTQLTASGNTQDYSTRTAALSANIATIKEKIASLESRLTAIDAEAEVVAAQTRVKQLQEKLEIAANHSEKLNRQVEQLSNTKGALRSQLMSAKSEQAKLQTELDQVLAKLASSKVTLHQMKAATDQANAKVANLLAKKAELEKLIDFKTNPNRIQLARERVEHAEKDLAGTKAKLVTAQETLEGLRSKKTSLATAITTAEHQLSLLKTLAKEKERRHPEVAIVKETSRSLGGVTEQAIDNPTLVRQDSKLIASNAIVSKVASAVKESANKKSYGKTSVSNRTSKVDESTQLALKAGIVMLAAVGLAGVKFRKKSSGE
ncbi:SEC10/PgrA surface exclusion domain-containing protein [Streptococcus castoreus]|uniref:SEC10/PgrA surface exclusion domain-containing protein n=1 Tax=Streptococcus castoreus TaxID=254786 RepID=UPI0003FC500F|nr:SEC10/PgrA surface exclusion domain-containing protein [Streptococcus castoreus]